jgi:cobalt-zinc-cadmium efflux system membrane fusion protein
VHCHFDRVEKSLVPGTYMNAIIELRNKKAWVLPEESIVRYEGNDYIFIENKPGNYDMVEITTGTKENGFTEVLVTEPLTSESIVLKGAYTLLMSLKNKAEE